MTHHRLRACAGAMLFALAFNTFVSIVPAQAQSPGPTVNATPTAATAPGTDKPTDALAAPLVVQTVNLVLRVADVETALNRVYALSTESRGFVSALNVSKAEGGARATFTLKVPATKLDFVLNTLRGEAMQVRDQRSSGQDVSAEYVDLSLAARNIDASEAQYRDLMKRMDKTEDVIRIFDELKRLRGESEKLRGRMNQLIQLADLATLNITMVQEAALQPTATPTATATAAATGTPTPTPTATPGWSADKELTGAGGQFARRGEGLLSALIQFGIGTLPFLLLALVPILLLMPVLRVFWRRYLRRLAAAEAAVTSQTGGQS